MSINITTKKSRHFSFDVQTATDYGVDEAIMIQNFIFWIEKNLANGKNHHDGHTWTYNTQEAFTFLFPFWSKKQVWRIIGSLEKQGVLLKGNYNQSNYDKTLWYAFKDESQWLNFPEKYPQSLEDVDIPKREHRDSQTGTSGFPNGNIGIPKREHRDSQTASPIPYITTNALPDLKNNNTLEQSEILKSSSDKIPLLSLSFLNPEQTATAVNQLRQLSPEQQKLAIEIYANQASKGIASFDKTPVIYWQGLIRLGKTGGLQPINAVINQTAMQSPAKTIEDQKNALIVKIKEIISNPRNKEKMLKKFEISRSVLIDGMGHAFKDDLKLAGLFD